MLSPGRIAFFRSLPIHPMSTPSHTPFVWTDAFLLGYEPMDKTHHEFVEVVEALQSASDDQLAACLEAFARHAEEHFAQERKWMEATEFPAAQCHIDEHEQVLKSVYEVRDFIAGGGEKAVVRSLAAELVRWFPGHADYMDASLAQWMAKRQLGGTPIVLKRGVAVADK